MRPAERFGLKRQAPTRRMIAQSFKAIAPICAASLPTMPRKVLLSGLPRPVQTFSSVSRYFWKICDPI